MILNRELYKNNGLIKGFSLVLRTIFVGVIRRVIRWKSQNERLEQTLYKKIENEQKRGKPYLTLKENGELRCTSCLLCVKICPAECIEITLNSGQTPQSETPPKEFSIDMLKCIFCGFCEEVCPVDAIRLSNEQALADHSEGSFKSDIQDLAFRKELNEGNGIEVLK